MNVAMPEFDGRIITVPISFKEPLGEPTTAMRRPLCTAARPGGRGSPAWRCGYAALRRTPNAEKRIAFVLTNSPGKAARIGNAVGLDAPASLLRLLACAARRRVQPSRICRPMATH